MYVNKKEAAEAIAQKIRAFGVPTDPYARGPAGGDTAIVALNPRRNTLRIWPGIAEVTVHGDKRQRQVVINVTEKARTISRRVTVDIRLGSLPDQLKVSKGKPVPGVVSDALERRFPISMPEGTKFTATDIQPGEVSGMSDWAKQQQFTGTVTAKTKATRMSFLVGADEQHLFISRLPQDTVKSVAEAHRLLKPKRATKHAHRQGEWFFEPASQSMQATLDARVARNPNCVLSGPDRLREGRGWGRRQWNHQTTTMVEHKGRQYAIGWCVDTEKRHAPLFLSEWCEVLRNRELDPPPEMSGRSWD